MVTTWIGVSIPKLFFLLSSAEMAIWCYLIHSESWQNYHWNTVPKTPFLCLFRGFVISAVDFDKIWDCWRMGMGMYETAWNSSFLLWTPRTHHNGLIIWHSIFIDFSWFSVILAWDIVMGQSMSKPQDRWVLGCTPSWLHLSGAVRDAEFDCCSPAGAMGLKRRPSRCVPRHWKQVLNF